MKPLVVIGNVNVDLIMGPAAPWPQPGTEIILDHDELRVGGSAGNTALAWQAMGVDFAIAANTGSDVFGTWLANGFGDHADHWPVHAGSTTLSVGIVHPDGERTFFTTRGHLVHFSLEDVKAALEGHPLRGGYALVCGSFLTDRLVRDYDALFAWAEAEGLSLALDTGWPTGGWTDETRASARHWLSHCRIALFNEVETAMLTGTDDPFAAARAMAGLMPAGSIVVVKRGPEGALALDGTGGLHVAPAPKVTVIDTIGAGDVFNAGFLAALAAGETVAESLAAGVGIASSAISTHPRSYETAIRGAGA